MTSALVAAILMTGTVAGAGTMAGAGLATVVSADAVPSAGSTYRQPLITMRVLTPFSPPAEKYGAGHLGVELAASAGVSVQAAGAGVVRFAGSVAGRGVVVLVHPDGISTEYEPVATVVKAGQRVVAGQRIATVHGTHRGCVPASCLHWGARRGGAYLDPLSLLAPLGVVRLLPWR